MNIKIVKILNLDYSEVRKVLTHLDKTGELNKLLPELVNLKGVEVVDNHYHKDNFIHTLQVTENTFKESEDIRLRLVAILHDIGKAKTKRFIKGQGWTFSNHEFIGGKMILNIFKRLNIPMDIYDYVNKLVVIHGRPKELTHTNITESALRRLATDMGTIENLNDLFLFCKCDITTKMEDKLFKQQEGYDNLHKQILEVIKKDKENEWRCPIDGNMIIKHFGVNGKDIKIIKTKIEEAIKSGEVKDDYDSAYDFMLRIKLNYD